METEFQNILRECIQHPNGEVAKTEMSVENAKILNDAEEALLTIEKNWKSLQEAKQNGKSTKEWYDESLAALKNKFQSNNQ